MLGEAKFAYLADFVLRVPHREVRAKEDALDAVEVDELAEVALAHEGDEELVSTKQRSLRKKSAPMS